MTGAVRDIDVFGNAPVALCISRDRIIQTCNPRFAEMFAGRREDFDDRPLLSLYPSTEDYERIGKAGLAAMLVSGRFADERIMRRLDGSLFWCQVSGQSLSPEAPFRLALWSFADLSAARPVVDLTVREREVIVMTCQGMTSKEIGGALGVSYRTVELHRARLLQKFAARNIAELVAKFVGLPM
ncbi:MAG: LuxR C-terminal-related transcriptional regulator [Rhizobiaceae bacterium]